MEETYKERYGVEGSVLYPSRAKGCNVVSTPVVRSRESRAGLVFAYAGSVNYEAYGDLLRTLAEALDCLLHNDGSARSQNLLIERR